MKEACFKENTGIPKTFLDILNESDFEKSLYKSGMFYVDYAEEFGHISKVCEDLGYCLSEMTSKKYQKNIHEDDLDTYLRLWNRFNEGFDDELYCEYRLLNQDNNWNWVQTHATVLSRDNSGSIRKIIGFDRNINGRKKTEEIIHEKLLEERKKNELSEIILSASKNVIANLDLSENLYEGLDKMKNVVDFDYCAVFIYKGKSNQVIYYPQNEDLALANITQLLKQVKDSKYPIINDTNISSTGSVMAVPLISDSDHVGSLILFNKRTDSFSGTDLYPVISFADILTVAIVNHYTLSKIVRDLEKDHLTGFLTRKSFQKAMEDIWDDVCSDKQQINVCMMDIDHFKRVNDSYGHQMGDVVIRIIAHICQNILREGDILGRYGGDEFIIVIVDNGIDDVEKIMERIRESIEKYEFSDLDHGVTTSIGISQVVDGDSIESIIKRADSALYKSKQSGRNQITIT